MDKDFVNVGLSKLFEGFEKMMGCMVIALIVGAISLIGLITILIIWLT